ncbi:hypothetical protein [Pseudomonas oryzihabitans]|uniref:hypothetical protein n=1 Tax=Pseudomonas oryzihabitans TaxID=47885 RepID=UPI000696C6D5|nr:hypothetical protein [Pseudomonas oryzihabitans]
MPTQEWIDHAYPLKQLTIKLQGTRHSDTSDIIKLLESVVAQLKAGETAGSVQDDDFGYAFKFLKESPGPSFFSD